MGILFANDFILKLDIRNRAVKDVKKHLEDFVFEIIMKLVLLIITLFFQLFEHQLQHGNYSMTVFRMNENYTTHYLIHNGLEKNPKKSAIDIIISILKYCTIFPFF